MKSAITSKDDENKEEDESSGSRSSPVFNNGDSCTRRASISAAYTALCVLPDIPQ